MLNENTTITALNVKYEVGHLKEERYSRRVQRGINRKSYCKLQRKVIRKKMMKIKSLMERRKMIH